MCVFLLQWLAVVLAGPRLSQRTGTPTDIEPSKSQRRNSTVVTVTWVAATLYSIFLPFYLGTAWFYIGLAFFIIGLFVLITSTLNFARAPVEDPVTGGVYRYSRHPIYLSMYFIYVGVSIATVSWLFFLITILTVILQHQTAILEENYCLEKYSDTYREYMKRTPRWIGVPKSAVK
jgi:protein-S-isoprenylcysteine O-methyltransferase Ste14